MRIYKDLDYITEHLEEIINETTIKELEMYPDYEDTEYWFYVKTENGKTVKIGCHLYVKWFSSWYIAQIDNKTIEEE